MNKLVIGLLLVSVAVAGSACAIVPLGYPGVYAPGPVIVRPAMAGVGITGVGVGNRAIRPIRAEETTSADDPAPRGNSGMTGRGLPGSTECPLCQDEGAESRRLP